MNVEYMYAFLGGRKDAGYMILRVADDAKASAAKGIRLIEADEPANL